MRIAHFAPTAVPVMHQRGGAVQRRILELAQQQAGAGHDVRVFSIDDVRGEARVGGATIVRRPPRTNRPWRDYEVMTWATRKLQRSPADILHFHGSFEGARMARHLRTRSVMSVDYFKFRLGAWRLGHWYCRRGLLQYDRLLPVSDFCAAAAQTYWDLPASHMHVVPNGVSLSQFRPDETGAAPLRTKLGLTDNPVVLYVGRLCRQKGTDVLLDAWELLQPHGAQLVMAGPVGQFGRTGDSDEVRRLNQVGGRYLGAVDEAELTDVYNLCDIFVMPTRADEMFGMAALEAQACGKPVIASDLGGLPEAVGAQAGRFFTPGNSRELATVLSRLLSDPAERRSMAAAAVAHAKEFDWRVVADRVQSVYESVLS